MYIYISSFFDNQFVATESVLGYPQSLLLFFFYLWQQKDFQLIYNLFLKPDNFLIYFGFYFLIPSVPDRFLCAFLYF